SRFSFHHLIPPYVAPLSWLGVARVLQRLDGLVLAGADHVLYRPAPLFGIGALASELEGRARRGLALAGGGLDSGCRRFNDLGSNSFFRSG
ncbi:MAG: hypothetical protein RR758_05585, partial [Burkholderiaceae bacterium]